MTEKEKAAEMYRHKTPEHDLTVTGTFLAGCAYQEQVDREVIESLINDIRYIAKNPLLLNTTDLQESLIEVLNNYHKAMGQAEKE